MWKAIGIIWRCINQNNCNCKVLLDDDDAANNNGFCLHELCTRRRTLFAFCDQYHLSRWKDSLPPVIRLVSSRHPSQLERRKTVGCISLLKRPVISYCTQHCLFLHIVQVAAFLFSSIHTADDDSMIPISNWNQSLVHIHFLSFCSKLAFLLVQNLNLRLKIVWDYYLAYWFCTCGILKSRSKLATWIEVTDDDAPTTPEMTLFRTWGTLPSWHL